MDLIVRSQIRFSKARDTTWNPQKPSNLHTSSSEGEDGCKETATSKRLGSDIIEISSSDEEAGEDICDTSKHGYRNKMAMSAKVGSEVIDGSSDEEPGGRSIVWCKGLRNPTGTRVWVPRVGVGVMIF